MKPMDYDTAGELLDRYFAGDTSLDDEGRLRDYFATGPVDPAHQPYADLFAYWAAAKTVTAPPARMAPTREIPMREATVRSSRLRSLRFVASAAAAVLLLLLANAWCNRQPDPIAGPIAGTAFPIPTPTQPKTIDWSKYEVSADEAGYRALRGALKTASTAINSPTEGVIKELDKLGARLSE